MEILVGALGLGSVCAEPPAPLWGCRLGDTNIPLGLQNQRRKGEKPSHGGWSNVGWSSGHPILVASPHQTRPAAQRVGEPWGNVGLVPQAQKLFRRN